MHQKTASEKKQQPRKIFLGELGNPLAPVVIYLLNPFPATPNLLRLSNCKIAQKQRRNQSTMKC